MEQQRGGCMHKASRRPVDIELSSWSGNLYSSLGLYLTVKRCYHMGIELQGFFYKPKLLIYAESFVGAENVLSGL